VPGRQYAFRIKQGGTKTANEKNIVAYRLHWHDSIKTGNRKGNVEIETLPNDSKKKTVWGGVKNINREEPKGR